MKYRSLIALGFAGLFASACTMESSPCAEAAAQLSGCSDDQKQAFFDACEQGGGADAAALTSEDTTAACTAAVTNGATDAATAAKTGVCVAAMYGVKWTVTALSPSGRALSAATKSQLRPLYGSLVDQVTITVGAKLPPRIVIAGHELSVQPDAMTFGTHVFMLREVGDDPDRLLLTTVHELTHAQQSQRAGGFYGFAVSYCRDMIAAGFDYDQIHMEQSAYAIEDTAARNLQSCGAVVCP
jgi:hypothetical protein